MKTIEKRLVPLPASTSVRRALRAAWDFLDKIQNLTTEEFSRGGERVEREALRAALSKIERPGKRGVTIAGTEVIRDPSVKEVDAWVVVVSGRLTTASFNSRGAAEACRDMIVRGERKPEFLS